MTDAEREKAIKFLQGVGLTDRPDIHSDGIHSWRCEYPDRYGHCNCFNEVVDEFLKDWTERPMAPIGESELELIRDLRAMLRAFGEPVIEWLRGSGWDVRKSRTGVTPESLESQGPPSVAVVAEGIIAIISADGAETIDLTFDQAEGLAARLAELARG